MTGAHRVWRAILLVVYLRAAEFLFGVLAQVGFLYIFPEGQLPPDVAHMSFFWGALLVATRFVVFYDFVMGYFYVSLIALVLLAISTWLSRNTVSAVNAIIFAIPGILFAIATRANYLLHYVWLVWLSVLVFNAVIPFAFFRDGRLCLPGFAPDDKQIPLPEE